MAYSPRMRKIAKEHQLEHKAMRNAGLGAQLSKVSVAGLGVVQQGHDIPDDLVATALEQGSVIALYDDVLSSSVPPEQIAGPAVMPSSTGPGFMVISPEVAAEHDVPILYDPMVGASDPSPGRGRKIGTTVTMISLGMLAGLGLIYVTNRMG